MTHRAIVFFLAASLCACAQTQKPKAPATAAPAMPEVVVLDTSWTDKVLKTNEEWRKILTPEQYHITREQGTERPFSSPLYTNKEEGVYLCVSCSNPLFSSDAKFNSGTGWPSYFAPFAAKSLSVAADNSHGMSRDEISCLRCGAHLGHVFDDGPPPTGLRYCIDGFALKFVKKEALRTGSLQKFTMAAGCFWCVEHVFENVRGVTEAVSGYAGGTEKNPTYESVGSGQTGHAEAVEVTYDPAQVSFRDLLRVFFACHNPTQVKGQGPDRGPQYRTIIFYRTPEEQRQIDDFVAELTRSGKYSKPIAAEVTPYTTFWLAEAYHQNYVPNHPENPYVQHESLPRFRRTVEAVPEFFKPQK